MKKKKDKNLPQQEINKINQKLNFYNCKNKKKTKF